MGLLRILNVALTQLHPTSWETLQAFRLIYDAFKLRSSPQSLLFYYNSRATHLVGWLSLPRPIKTSRRGTLKCSLNYTVSHISMTRRENRNSHFIKLGRLPVMLTG